MKRRVADISLKYDKSNGLAKWPNSDQKNIIKTLALYLVPDGKASVKKEF